MAGIFVLSLALFMKSFIQPGEITGITAMPFYNLVFGSIHTIPFLDRLVALVFLLVIGYMLIRIGVRYVLLEFRSFMPAFFFLLFTVALPSAQHVTPALVGSVFYLLCFAILFDLHDKRPDTFSVFTAGIVLAFGSMFYLKLIWFLPLIWISLVTMRTVTWREMFYPVDCSCSHGTWSSRRTGKVLLTLSGGTWHSRDHSSPITTASTFFTAFFYFW